MAKWNSDFYHGEGGYSDGAIENEILEIVKSGKDLKEVLKEDKRWPILYHFSPQRENIMNWYPFKEGKRILEIGAGCGGLTGFFCGVGKQVTAVELTKLRSEINYERNKKYENLEIITGNFHKIKFKEKFDYIILNGVFEYAASFKESENPYVDFLTELKDHLNPNGKILIAIENRLGLKYFNGAKEDHTGKLFSGLNNYKEIDFVKTFSKKEMEELIIQAGYQSAQFYYPMGDYKFPEVIYTEETFKFINYSTPMRAFDRNRFLFFSEEEMRKTLIKENIFHQFANSFFIEITEKEEDIKEKVVFAKISNYRKDKFAIITKIVETKKGKVVRKIGLTFQAVNHLKEMLKYQEVMTGTKIINVPIKNTKDGIEMEFIDLNIYEDYLMDCFIKEDYTHFEERIKDFCEVVYENSELGSDFYTNEFFDVFGKEKSDNAFHWKEKVNIDLLFTNIFYDCGDYRIIDYEWSFNFMIPLEYVLWRGLKAFFINNEEISKKYTIEEIMTLGGINLNKFQDVFDNWEKFFLYEYVGVENYQQYEKKKLSFEPYIVDEILEKDKISTSLYIDYGEGFSQEEALIVSAELDENKFLIKYEIPKSEKEIKLVRWDPCEESCKIKNVMFEMDGKNIKARPLNALVSYEGYNYFLTADPAYVLEGIVENACKIEVTGELKKLDKNEILLIVNNRIDKGLGEKNRLIEKKEKELELQRRIIEGYRVKNEELFGSNSWKVTKPMRMIGDIIRKGRKK